MMRRLDKIVLRYYTQNAKGRVFQKNEISHEDHFADPGVPRVACTKDNSTIVMYHPQSAIKYEDTIPIPRHDPKYTSHENVDSLVREKLDDLGCADKSLEFPRLHNPLPMSNRETIPIMMHLANMFYTTKHVWFPRSQLRKKRPTPPPDRPIE